LLHTVDTIYFFSFLSIGIILHLEVINALNTSRESDPINTKTERTGSGKYQVKKRGNLMVAVVVKAPKTTDKDILKVAENMDAFYSADVRGKIKL